MLVPNVQRSALLVVVWLSCQAAATVPGSSIVKQTRRMLNLGSLMGSATQQLPYDRVIGHPVFQVTTAWGSAYMNMEKLNDLDQDDNGPSSGDNVLQNKNPNSIKSISEEQNEYRTVTLYFMDPDDALAVHAELKQMEQMKDADIRITSTSLGKALRQSANLGNGLVTGFPIDALSGALKSPGEGGSLRHKILPPKRQLFYAARCRGKERVGFFGTPEEQAAAAILGNSAIEGFNLMRRRDKRERKSAPIRTAMEAQNAHMEGYTGIPVFYAQGMQRHLPKLKQLVSGNRQETPLFFNYEDLMEAWDTMMTKSNNNNKSKQLPPKPTVEVFNLWDVLTSMEKDAWKQKQTNNGKKKSSSSSSSPIALDQALFKPLKRRFGKLEPQPGLDSITFVPSSRATNYKEAISARGNGKARLRPMR